MRACFDCKWPLRDGGDDASVCFECGGRNWRMSYRDYEQRAASAALARMDERDRALGFWGRLLRLPMWDTFRWIR